MSKLPTLLLTGSKGFLGKVLFKELIKQGKYKIVIADHQDYNLADFRDCLKVVKTADVVIHTAGLVLSRAEQQKRSAEVLYQNTVPLMQILEASRCSNVKKVILISSMTAYPEDLKPPFSENDLWKGKVADANKAYGVAKRLTETVSDVYNRQYGIKIINLILPNIYGPKDKFNFNPPPLVPNAILQIYKAKKQKLTEFYAGDNGNFALDLIYIADVVKSIILALEKDSLPVVLNIGTGKPEKIKDLFSYVAKFLNFSGKIKWDGSPSIKPRYLNVKLMHKYLKWQPKFSLQEGLKLTINDFLKNEK